jgi:N-acetylmuramoyl-L-alanine amidase
MIVLLRKRDAAAAALGLFLLCGAAVWMLHGRSTAVSTSGAADTAAARIVIVDPGHGGEDGGAVAEDGTVESGVNLEISRRIYHLLLFCGQPAELTRSEDISIHSADAETLRQKKVSDLHNRVDLVNRTPEALLVSIHQNCLPASRSVHGAQVFFNGVDGAEPLALSVQETLNSTINAGNEKGSRRISPTIYLMENVTAPSILVECGFLSNAKETALLCTAAYQTQLAAAITAGILKCGTE